jgi:hypothetical protein
MKGQTLQVRIAGGMDETLPQHPYSATLIENWTVDRRTQAFSSRIGFEKYRPDPAEKFAPFTTLGRIDSLFVLNQAPGGARQSILFESGGTLYLYYEVGQASTIVALQSGRIVPTATESGSVYTQFADRVVITNGQDAPFIVRPWPLPKAPSFLVAGRVGRPLGWTAPPPAPGGLQVALMGAVGTGSSTNSYTGSSTTNWYPAYSLAVSFPGIFGMGYHVGGTDGVSNDYQFKVAYISDTGSVSPLSLPVDVEWDIPTGVKGFRYCPTLRIPVGPEGTVARRIYATQDDGSTFYFVADVRNNVEELFHAFRRGSSLSIEAPGATESVPLPAPYARVSASFKDCLWLDGGRAESNRLFYSQPGLPDQFGAANYITLTGGGGAITGLYAHYNNLLIFRENSIDVLAGAYPTFTVQTITKQVSCRSPHSVDAVPGLGVVFLAQDGIYALTGGLDGGAVFEVVPLGASIQKQTVRLTKECAARAVGRYSPQERAYHLYIPVDGDDRPGLGCVFHLDKKGWSVRVGFPVGCIDRTYNGTLIFGHHSGTDAGADKPAGLFAITSTRALGGSIVEDSYSVGTPPTSIYESCWHDFGDAQVKKQVQYVTLWVQTTGSVSVKLKAYKDFEYTVANTDERFLYQPPDQANQPVYNTAVTGTAAWQDSRLVPIRVPVAVQSCSWFKFRIETTDDVLFVGYELDYVSRGTIVIAGKRS